jgi:hypothetical protein
VANPVKLGARLVLAVLLAIALLALPRWTIRKQWQSEAWVRESVSGVADESGVEWTGPTMAGRYPWQGLFGQRAAKDVVLVYPRRSRMSLLYFPKSFFADESTWHAFRGLLRAKGPARE